MNSLDRLKRIAALSFFLVTVAFFNMSFVQLEDSIQKPESTKVDTVVSNDKMDSCCVSPVMDVKKLHKADSQIDEIIKASMQKAMSEMIEKADQKTDSQFSIDDEVAYNRLRSVSRAINTDEISQADASMTLSLTRDYFIGQLHQACESDVAIADNRSDGHFFSRNQLNLDSNPARYAAADQSVDAQFKIKSGVALIATIK